MSLKEDNVPIENNSAPFLVITRHDYRSHRKANMHFIAKELSKRGYTRFFSFGFSNLSRLKDDPRLSLWKRANKVEVFEGVESYLWRTILHPISLRSNKLAFLEKVLFKLYVSMAPAIFKKWITDSNTILFESGFPIIFIRLCKRLNPNARLLYIASDDLDAIDCASYIISEFHSVTKLFDGMRLPSYALKDTIQDGAKIFFVPHGIDKSIAEHTEPSPYVGGINAVSVGSMLFDANFFKLAANAFPEITFHIIGGGVHARNLNASNIKLYDEMPFLQTIPFIKHADIGIAPYNGYKVAPFLADTSMKLMQYGFLGLPAVCPNKVIGNYKGRFGYNPDDAQSIIKAIQEALDYGHFGSNYVLTWKEVTERILNPRNYSDTKID